MHNQVVKSSPELAKPKMWLQPRLGFTKCLSCRACRFGINTTHYFTPFCPDPIAIRGCNDCKTEFEVYVLTCTCNLRYVGSTRLQVHVRTVQHLRAVVNNDSSYPVARHFKQKHNNNLQCLTYYVIAAIPKLRRRGDRNKLL